MTEQKRITILFSMAAFGVAMVWAATHRHGIGIWPDSVAYIGAARHLLAGDGFITYNDAPFVRHAPLYPLLLAALGCWGWDLLSAALCLNALLFGLIVYLSGILFFRCFPPALALLGTAAVLFSKPVFMVATGAWTEPLFIFFVLSYFLLHHAYAAKKSAALLAGMACAAALACLTRYIGVTLVLAGAVTLLRQGGVRSGRGAPAAAVFALCSSLPLAAWGLRNWLVADTIFGRRVPSAQTLAENIGLALESVLSWYLPIAELRRVSAFADAPLFGFALLGAWGAVAGVARLLRHPDPVIAFAAVYTAFLITASTLVAYNPIGQRLMSAAYVPITLILFKMIDGFSRVSKSRARRRAVLICIALWLSFPAASCAYWIARAVDQGVGEYDGRAWRESETLRYVRRNSWGAGAPLYSNAPDAIYILTDARAKISPFRKTNSIREAIDISEVADWWPGAKGARLVWFDNKSRSYLFTVEELRQIAVVRRIARFDDGAVYFAKPLPPPSRGR